MDEHILKCYLKDLTSDILLMRLSGQGIKNTGCLQLQTPERNDVTQKKKFSTIDEFPCLVNIFISNLFAVCILDRLSKNESEYHKYTFYNTCNGTLMAVTDTIHLLQKRKEMFITEIVKHQNGGITTEVAVEHGQRQI